MLNTHTGLHKCQQQGAAAWLAQATPRPPRPLALSSARLQVELAPRGQDTPVTAENRLAYIHRVADYRLNQQIREPTAAFLRCRRGGSRPASDL